VVVVVAQETLEAQLAALVATAVEVLVEAICLVVLLALRTQVAAAVVELVNQELVLAQGLLVALE
jgi:hypothetical protein